MSWLPDIPPLFTWLKRIENEEDLLKDSTEFFWLVCNKIMNPEEFKERMAFWKGIYEEDKRKGSGGFTDPELEAIMARGSQDPEEATQIMLEKFDSVVDEKFVEYLPDEPDPVLPLYCYLHLEAARLFRLLKVQSYSDVTRVSIEKALNALTRCYRALKRYTEKPWSLEYSISLESVGSFLNITHFFILKSDGRYEDALVALLEGLEHIKESYSIFDNNRRSIFEGIYFYHMSFTKDMRKTAPWMKDIRHQMFVDCFEAIRKINKINDKKRLIEICESFIDYSDESWLSNTRSNDLYITWSEEKEISSNVETEEYIWDYASEYWHNALGWVEAQLTPSEFKEIIDEREEQAAERRLQRYFFEKDIWVKLPDRAKRSLISADRDWFSGYIARIEAILNELKVAVEESLLHGLWNPLIQWVKCEGEANKDFTIFKEMVSELNNKKLLPDISHFERLCSYPIVVSFLKKRGVNSDKREWFTIRLPQRLAWLRRARRKAEHKSNEDWTYQELGKYYTEFMGIGKLGIIPEVARILFL